jgi:hypothetical protein
LGYGLTSRTRTPDVRPTAIVRPESDGKGRDRVVNGDDAVSVVVVRVPDPHRAVVAAGGQQHPAVDLHRAHRAHQAGLVLRVVRLPGGDVRSDA